MVNKILEKLGGRDKFLFFLAFTIVVGFFLLSAATMIYTIPATQEKGMFMILGAWISAFSTVMSYFFGSSRGSQQKDQTLSGMVNKNKDVEK